VPDRVDAERDAVQVPALRGAGDRGAAHAAREQLRGGDQAVLPRRHNGTWGG
jgi:hypothetical protein